MRVLAAPESHLFCEIWANGVDNARGVLANYFAKEAITRFANDPIDIEKDRERGALLPKAPQRNYPG